MNHKTDVRLVDSHTESNGGDNHIHILHQELVLILSAHLRIQSCVVRQGLDAVDLKELGHLFHLAAGQAIYDAGLAWVLAYESDYILVRVQFVLDFVIKVGTVEGRLEYQRIRYAQSL